MYYQTRFVVDNSAAILTDVVGNGSQYGEAFLFGAEACIEAIALLEEVRRDPPSDLGRSKKIGWYAILQWKKMWSLASDDLNSVGKGLERIVKVTSA